MNTVLFCVLSILTLVNSPDGKLSVTIDKDENSAIHWSAAYKGETILSPSLLGLKTNEADYSLLEFIDASSETIRVNYDLDRIKTGHIEYDATRAITHFRTPSGRLIDIEWHLSSNDIAFRYILPKDTQTGSIRVLSELTSFNFPSGTTTYICPQSDAMIGWKRSKPSYEEHYKIGALMSEPSQYGQGYTFPCLFRTPSEGWVLVSETGVDSHYCGSHLSDYSAQTGYSIAFPMMGENNGNGTVEPGFSLPGKTPWRTITVGEDLAPIVETTIAFDVVEPKYKTNYDYRYGKSTWSWILWQDNSINDKDIRAYVDLAAEMGYPYTLIDAWWDANIGRQGIEDIVKYAKSKGVEVFLWYSSSGWWNDIMQSPSNIMSEHIERKKEMNWMKSIGIKGIKVDFFGGDKQETMRLYESILSDADDNGLMVIFHGCTLPRGWERMYPNYVGSEAVLASENLVFGQAFCDDEAQNACLHPFIRNTVGCMEYGGTFLNKRLSRDNKRGTIRRTSDAFELALSIIYQNPIQNFALAPNNLQDAPAEALNFLRGVPTTWDETRYIDGLAGQSAVLARRHGDTWYVGAINASDTPLELDLSYINSRIRDFANEHSYNNIPESKTSGADLASSKQYFDQATSKHSEGASVEILSTRDGNLVQSTLPINISTKGSKKKQKPLLIPKNDGAVVIVKN